jgi:hypothetical protein
MPTDNDQIHPKASSDWPPLPTPDTRRLQASAVASAAARSRAWTTGTLSLTAVSIDLRIVSHRSDEKWR